MRTFLIVFALSLFPLSIIKADSIEPYGGINSTKLSGSGDWIKEYGFDFGVLYLKPIRNGLVFRTGLGIAQRNSDLITGINRNLAVDFLLLKIPISALYMITPYLGVWTGVSFDFVLDDDDISGAKAFAFNFPVGIRFNVYAEHSVETFWETGVTRLASGSGYDFRVGKTVGINYIYSFSF